LSAIKPVSREAPQRRCNEVAAGRETFLSLSPF
jgi:hypothetical protein